MQHFASVDVHEIPLVDSNENEKLLTFFPSSHTQFAGFKLGLGFWEFLRS